MISMTAPMSDYRLEPPAWERDHDDIRYCTDGPNAQPGEMCPVHDCGKPSDWRYICWECGHCRDGALLVTVSDDDKSVYNADLDTWSVVAMQKRWCQPCLAAAELAREVKRCWCCGERYHKYVDEVAGWRCLVCDDKAVCA